MRPQEQVIVISKNHLSVDQGIGYLPRLEKRGFIHLKKFGEWIVFVDSVSEETYKFIQEEIKKGVHFELLTTGDYYRKVCKEEGLL